MELFQKEGKFDVARILQHSTRLAIEGSSGKSLRKGIAAATHQRLLPPANTPVEKDRENCLIIYCFNATSHLPVTNIQK